MFNPIRGSLFPFLALHFFDLKLNYNFFFEGIGASSIDQGNTEIDERKLGEPWVQELTEGEYSDLSVEERLNALVALIGIANEGNIIRVVLEVILNIKFCFIKLYYIFLL